MGGRAGGVAVAVLLLLPTVAVAAACAAGRGGLAVLLLWLLLWWCCCVAGEALLQYAEVSEKDPKYMGAYKETQPETQFDTGEERMEKRAKPYFY